MRRKKGKGASHGLRRTRPAPAPPSPDACQAEVQAIRERRARRTTTAKHTAEIEAALEILRDLAALEARAAAVGNPKASP